MPITPDECCEPTLQSNPFLDLNVTTLAGPSLESMFTVNVDQDYLNMLADSNPDAWNDGAQQQI